MNAESRPDAIWRTRVGTPGDWATASLMIAAVSGVVLAVPYDPADAYGSLAQLILTNAPGVLFRNIHYWAGQLCFVLTLLHIWDHLRARTERRVGAGVWTRLALALPFMAFVMLSGFLLRGDADAQQALRILTEATAQLPLIGPPLATLVFGAAGHLDIIYIQHAATATIAVWLLVIEHSRRVWPRATPFVAVLAATTLLSLVASPGLHDGLDPIVKGPWYFLGLQEVLHWTSWPVAVVLAGALFVVALAFIRRATEPASRRWKITLAAALGVYGVLCLIGAFVRGENWSVAPAWPSGSGNVRVAWVFAATPDVPDTLPVPLPAAMGRPEGCLVCHRGVTGLGNAHRPDAVGCASCHGGDPLTLVKARAHAGMDLIPGTLATATRRCGQAACHPTIVLRVERSLMTTMRGVIAVNREVFGDAASIAGPAPAHVATLSRAPADTHLRQLCASCHVGAGKTALGPNGEDARGGGCNACHLTYDAGAEAALGAYEHAKRSGRAEPPTQHPAVRLDVGSGLCFGCHSRSGRISTNFEGWHEVHEPPAGAGNPQMGAPARHRVLADERVFERVLPDVHQQRGLDCIDCHTANEVMGDGQSHARKSDALRVTCEDCHAAAADDLRRLPVSQLDPESRRILALREWPGLTPTHIGAARSGEHLINVVGGAGGALELVRKRSGDRRPLKPAAPVCVEGAGHARLSCGSCHTAWAPRCPTCHTSFDPKIEAYDWVDDVDVAGAWKERAGPYVANRPTLGVRHLASPSGGRTDVVETFVPGMIMTLDRTQGAGAAPDEVFRRLYARIEPHTTRREARSCESCHNDSEAIGYGRGVLAFERTGRTGRWRFAPAAPATPTDGLPADAWIPFLGERTGPVSTRPDVRPFLVEEQRRILTVGACLTCHPGDSPVMKASVRRFDALLARRSARCVLPAWD